MLSKIPDGKHVYDKVQPKAEGVKAIAQIAIGVLSIIILLIQFDIHFGEGMGHAADRALLIVGVALAFSAAVELAYTFFTDGPDEALDPLILGISAFTLIIISQSKWIDELTLTDSSKNLTNTSNLNAICIPVLLLAISILVLFVTRKFLLEVRKDGSSKNDQPPPGAHHG